jgi:hypothetical protein
LFVAGADLVLLNIEGAIGSGPAPPKCTKRSKNCFAFRMPPSAGTALRSSDRQQRGDRRKRRQQSLHDAGDEGAWRPSRA